MLHKVGAMVEECYLICSIQHIILLIVVFTSNFVVNINLDICGTLIGVNNVTPLWHTCAQCLS